jgi:hypothetical protein
MDPKQEKELLLKGITKLKRELAFASIGPAAARIPHLSSARSIDILERLETLRNCLEILVSKELLTSSKEI